MLVTRQHSLQSKLLEFVVEQSKDIDPNAFNLSKVDDFKRLSTDLAGLPGVDFDLRIEGDHLWLQIKRLEAERPPPFTRAELRSFINEQIASYGHAPNLNEIALKHQKGSGHQEIR